MADRVLERCLRRALEQLERDLAESAPTCHRKLRDWFPAAFSPRLEDLWLKPTSFPLLQLPYWFARAHGHTVAPFVLEHVSLSSMSGYLYVRLIDKAMDGDDLAEPRLLPAAAALHARFQGAFQELFPAQHPFWPSFYRTWSFAADVTVRDRFLQSVSESDFEHVSARKFSAAKIPLTAVAWHIDRFNETGSWFDFVDRLGRWFQLNNDFFDWRRDQLNDARTLVLSDAERRRRSDESTLSWFAREGIAQWVNRLRADMSELRTQSAALHSPALVRYLTRREQILEDRLAAATTGAVVLQAVASAVTLGSGTCRDNDGIDPHSAEVTHGLGTEPPRRAG
jgi:hypothetical protein